MIPVPGRKLIVLCDPTALPSTCTVMFCAAHVAVTHKATPTIWIRIRLAPCLFSKNTARPEFVLYLSSGMKLHRIHAVYARGFDIDQNVICEETLPGSAPGSHNRLLIHLRRRFQSADLVREHVV